MIEWLQKNWCITASTRLELWVNSSDRRRILLPSTITEGWCRGRRERERKKYKLKSNLSYFGQSPTFTILQLTVCLAPLSFLFPSFTRLQVRGRAMRLRERKNITWGRILLVMVNYDKRLTSLSIHQTCGPTSPPFLFACTCKANVKLASSFSLQEAQRNSKNQIFLSLSPSPDTRVMLRVSKRCRCSCWCWSHWMHFRVWRENMHLSAFFFFFLFPSVTLAATVASCVWHYANTCRGINDGLD